MLSSPQIAFVITDGKQTKDQGPYEELDVASKGLKAAGVRVYGMGIGKKVDREELELIASDPNLVMMVDDFDALKDVVDDIRTNVCKGQF